jgi:hypothetical protein
MILIIFGRIRISQHIFAYLMTVERINYRFGGGGKKYGY